MPKHPRLMKRGNTYWHRAAIPADIKATYPKTEQTFSLQTKDLREALIRVRKAAVEVDEHFAAHRRLLAARTTPPVGELTKTHLATIEELYFAHLLDEDDEVRLEGFYDEGEPQPPAPVPTFEEHEENARSFWNDAQFVLARGKGDVFYRGEAEEVLSWDGLNGRLDEHSPSWKLAMRAIQSAIVRVQEAIAARSRGECRQDARGEAGWDCPLRHA